MKFFIDFEALQFSNFIISIGCVCENGNQFSSFIKPPKGKTVSKFITELTGITDETLANAPSIDEAFNAFYQFIIDNCAITSEKPEYFCYGDTDATFIKDSMKYINDVQIYTFAQALSCSLVDYQKTVRNFFVTPNNIALKKVYTLIKAEEVVQHHDALEDAMMLSEVVNKMKAKCKPEDRVFLSSMKRDDKPKRKMAPIIFQNWPGDKWEADTLGSASNYAVKATAGSHVAYFDTLETAALWIIRYCTRGLSPKREGDVVSVMNKSNKGIKEGKEPYGFKWEAFNN